MTDNEVKLANARRRIDQNTEQQLVVETNNKSH